ALGRQGGNTGMLSVHLRRLAETLLRQGDLELAECHAVEALGVARSINNQFEVAEALDHCARVALAQMDLAAATSYAREGLSTAHTLRTPRQIGMAIEWLGSIARQAGAWPQAIRLFAVAEVQRATTGEVSAAGAVQKIESYLLEIAAEHGDEPVSAAWATARAMGQDEAVSYALAADGPPVRAEPGGEPADPSAPSLPPGSHSPFPDHLTARELSVLRQLAAGRSNAEIAGDLVLSLRTVERHISNIYAKLSIHGSRSARASAAAHWHTHIGRRS
ncbi:MAG: helix-turn-helix transcriptional regulator, partial [Dehalococcoidia bacterium]